MIIIDNSTELEIHTHIKPETDFGILVQNISKSYDNLQALRDVNLNVESGKILALLGPNGAGKTTLIKILTTLLKPDSGYANVGGFDVVKDASKLRPLMGMAGQNVAVDENLTGRENLELVGRLYHFSKQNSKLRADELLREFDLVVAADRVVKTYSGGMRRRLDLASSLVAKPRVLFLDEPTAGLDPRSRVGLWSAINRLVENGTTVLLTTQYMEEADHLADTIVVLNHGQVIAEGTADDLKSKVGGDVIDIHLANHQVSVDAAALIRNFGSGEPKVDSLQGKITLPVNQGAFALVEIIRRLDANNILLENIILRRPSLDDVFLVLTGHITEENL